MHEHTWKCISVFTFRRQKLTPLHLSTDLFHKETFLAFQNNCKVDIHLYGSNCSGITSGRLLNGELYVQRLTSVIYVPIYTLLTLLTLQIFQRVRKVSLRNGSVNKCSRVNYCFLWVLYKVEHSGICCSKNIVHLHYIVYIQSECHCIYLHGWFFRDSSSLLRTNAVELPVITVYETSHIVEHSTIYVIP